MRPLEPSATDDDTNGQPLTGAEIGGIVGGVLGLFVVLGGIVWFIMRRLNEVWRFVRSQSELEQATASGDVSNNPFLGRPSMPTTHSHGPPWEVWDPHSEGRYPNTSRELMGSYEAHGVSEMEEERVRSMV